jgi:hypothetical protein
LAQSATFIAAVTIAHGAPSDDRDGLAALGDGRPTALAKDAAADVSRGEAGVLPEGAGAASDPLRSPMMSEPKNTATTQPPAAYSDSARRRGSASRRRKRNTGGAVSSGSGGGGTFGSSGSV